MTKRFSIIEHNISSFFGKSVVKKINFSLVILVSFFGIYLLNRVHPLFGDDWMYSMMPEPSNEHVRSFWDILKVQYAHYFTWGGRSVVHVIAQSLLLMGEGWADLLNSFAYVALTLVIYKLANISNTLKPSLLLGVNLLICIFQPAFGSTMLWITGSANYLWGTLIIASFLIPYRNRFLNIPSKESTLKSIVFLLFGIIAGWTNENMGVALIIMIASFLYLYKQKGSIPKWTILGFIGVCVGCVMMISAPGNFARYGASLAQTGTEGSAIVIFIKRFFGAIASFYYYALGLTFILCLSYIVYRKFANSTKRKEIYILSFLFFAGAIIATLAMSASPIFPGRAAYGLNTLIIIAVAMLYGNLNFSHFTIRSLSFCALTFGLLFFSADYYRGYRELDDARIIVDKRLDDVIKGKQEGTKDFTFNQPAIIPQTKFFHYFELPANANDWHNRMFSRYYEIDSIKVE